MVMQLVCWFKSIHRKLLNISFLQEKHNNHLCKEFNSLCFGVGNSMAFCLSRWESILSQKTDLWKKDRKNREERSTENTLKRKECFKEKLHCTLTTWKNNTSCNYVIFGDQHIGMPHLAKCGGDIHLGKMSWPEVLNLWERQPFWDRWVYSLAWKKKGLLLFFVLSELFPVCLTSSSLKGLQLEGPFWKAFSVYLFLFSVIFIVY